MKVVATSKDGLMESELDPHFGRAHKFILFDTESGHFTVHDNEKNLNAAQGAGIQAAQHVALLGAEILVTGNVGPKAFRALSAAGIRMYLAKAGSTVAGAIADCEKGKLVEATEANVEGHWV